MLDNAYMSSPQTFPILFKGSIDTGEISILKAEYSNAKNNVSWSTHNIDLTNLIEQIITEKAKSMNLPDKLLYL